MWGVAGLLLLVGLLIGWGIRRSRALSLLLLLGYSGLSPVTWSLDILDSPCLYETNYFCKFVYIARAGSEIGTAARQTFVVVAAQRPMPIGDDAPAPGERVLPVPSSLGNVFLSRAEWEEYLSQGTAIILTDDFVPVDNLLAPVFADSGL